MIFQLMPSMEGPPLKHRPIRSNLISGGVGLALAALWAAPATPLLAGSEQEKRKVEERPQEEAPRPQAPAKQRPAAQEQGQQRPAAQEQGQQRPAAQQPAQKPGYGGQAPAQKPFGGQAPAQKPGYGGQAPGTRPGGPVPMGQRPGPMNPATAGQGTGARPGYPGQGTGVRPGAPAPTQFAGHPGGAAPARDARPMNIVKTRDGGEIHRGPGGAVREVHTPAGAVIHYAPDGMRRVEVARPDGRVLFASGSGHGGYVQKPFMVHNQAFVQRTYVEHGAVYTRVYRPYVHAGITFNIYTPTRYYRPAYYSWAYQPWSRPVSYQWGWGQRPWYGYYRGYYAPYPYYASPIFWLTDFMVAATLESAYQDRIDNSLPPAPPSYDNGGMTPEVKQAIADEVRRQLDEERAEQQAASQPYAPPASAAPSLFSSNVSRIFLVTTSTVAYAGGQERFLSDGDVLQLNGAPAPDATYADVVVLASRSRGIPRGSVVSVSLVDLQEMQNHMRASIDQGLGDLQSHQGLGGLPPAPPQSLGGSDAAYASGLQPDANAAGELSQAAQDANASGQAVLSQSPAPAATGTVALGMNPDQVHNILGAPRQSATVGAKSIEVYQNFKVTYMNGAVSDIQ